MENNIYVGYINSFHGIKGELKVLSEFEKEDFVYKKGNIILIDNKEYEITSVRKHKNFILITVDNLFDINLVNNLIKKDIYFKKENLNLKEGEYLLSDLINYEIIDNEKVLGKVIEIRYNKIHKFLYCSYNNKNYYIPFIDNYINKVDIKNKIIYVKGAEELI